MLRAIARVLFWTYERGSLPYDIACGLILAFIFFTPSQVFDGTFFADSPATEPSAAESAQESLHEMPDPNYETSQKGAEESDPSKPTE